MKTTIARPAPSQKGKSALTPAPLAAAQIDGACPSARILPRREDLRFLNLLRAGGGETIEEEDPARRLVIGKPLIAPIEKRSGERGRGGDPRLHHDAGHHLLAANLVGHRQHRRLRHLVMREEGRLDLGGGDVLAGAADDILLAIDEEDHPAFILARDIPGVEPAAAPGLRGRRPVLEITGKEPGAGQGSEAAHQKLARLAQGYLNLMIIDDPRFEIEPGTLSRTADRARVD